ncbi:hypothetical protein RJ640_028977 [Escallonia rubra]|uniref:Uncharacterized protein n=1 Tax=Escallonia rubra TaxID=112253 RepID=A0AA88RJT8_9ASTE|nr:hypothetical protein RJ640_028977 [Escallonia rubra]
MGLFSAIFGCFMSSRVSVNGEGRRMAKESSSAAAAAAKCEGVLLNPSPHKYGVNGSEFRRSV